MIYIYRSVKKHNKVKIYKYITGVANFFSFHQDVSSLQSFLPKKKRKEPKKLAAKKSFNFSILMFEN